MERRTTKEMGNANVSGASINGVNEKKGNQKKILIPNPQEDPEYSVFDGINKLDEDGNLI